MTDIERIEQRMAALGEELDQLRAEVLRLRTTETTPPPDPGGAPVVASRRRLLSRGAVAAGAGLVGAGLVSRPVAAMEVTLGGANTTSTTTSITTTGSTAAGLHGRNTAPAPPGGRTVGLRGDVSASDGIGVEGTVDDSNAVSGRGPIGVYGHVVGFVNATGVLGEVRSGDSEAGGVIGEALDEGWGVIGIAGTPDDFGGGVLGTCGVAGGRGVSAVNQAAGGVALEASSSSGVGAVLSGGRAAVRLTGSVGMPAARTDAHSFGELYVDQIGRDLWYCTASGTPGTWVKLSDGAPLLRPVTPFRVYDSRFTGGLLTLGSTRIVDVSDSIDIETGSIVQNDAVPAGATAVTFNLTVFSTVGGGFLAATPGNATTFGTASVNWSGPGQVVGNATLVTLDAARRMKIFIGGTPGASAGFTVDVTGYVR